MPRRGIRVAPACIPKIKQALRRHGFPSQRALAMMLGLSRATITSFFNGKAIDYTNFVEICERLGLDWQAIAYIEEEEEETSPPAPLLQGEGCNPPGLTSPPTPLLQGEGCNLTPTPPFPRREGGQGGLGFDWRQISQEMLLAQNQQRLTTNPLTAGDGLTFELDEIYVPIGLVERKQRERLLGDISPEEGSRIYSPETSDEITQTFQNNEFFELVLRPGKSKRIAIIGEPGAGKTTLLQKIAVWVIDNTYDVPIWISLADLQGKTIEEYLLSNWLRSATKKVRVTPEIESALGELFNSGKVWLLLDGVDEMVTESGNALALLSKQLTGWVADARVVLTCRLNVWDAGKNALENFETYRNLDFSYGDAQTSDQVGQFIRCWFKNNPALAERLRTELDKSGRERIKDAVKNPLRLALLCRTWALGKGGLPNTKAGLYHQFTEALYEWKQEQFPTCSTQRQELNQALGELAKRAIAEEKTKFRLRHRLVREILGEPDTNLFKLALQLGWLNQVGVAAEAESCGEKVYAFYHPTFQEYFAAQAINDWNYFLNHIPHNPKQGTYRIFEPQWKEVILLWLGREEVSKEQKEELINTLVNFQDNCKGFYLYRAYFLAASGMAEFGDSAWADEIICQIIHWGFGWFYIEDKEQLWTLLKPIAEGARATLLETDRGRAIGALVKLIESTQDESTSRQATEILGKIDSSNQTAITVLLNLIESSDNEELCWEAIVRLGEVGTGNSTAIESLVKVIESNEDDEKCWLAVDSLGKIGQGNPAAVAALSQIIESNENELTCLQVADTLGIIAPGNRAAIAKLNQVIKSTKNEDFRWLAADSLGKIDPGNPEVITALVDLIKSTQYEYIRQQAAQSLGKVGAGNPDAIAALIELIKSTEYEHIRQQAAESLGKVGAGNPDAIAALVELIESSEDEESLRMAIESLGKIGSSNPKASAALLQLIKSDQNEFTQRIAIKNLGQFAFGNSETIAIIIQIIQSTQNEFTRRIAADTLGKIDPDNPVAITALVKLIESTKDEFTRKLAANSLREIGKNNLTAIAELVNLISSTESEYIRQQATFSLGEIGAKNQTAIAAIARLIESNENQFTRRIAAESLGKIDPGNQTAIAALVKLIESSEHKYPCAEVSNSLGEISTVRETAIAVLVRLIESTENELARQKSSDRLKDILRDEHLAGIVVALKEYLSHETYKNDVQRFQDCYKLIWHCAQNMSYPDFYQAWHNSTDDN
jgi:HEAT repeat protein